MIKYTKDGKGYELKVLVVDEHLMINLARLKDERVASLTIIVTDHVNRVDNEFEGYLTCFLITARFLYKFLISFLGFIRIYRIFMTN